MNGGFRWALRKTRSWVWVVDEERESVGSGAGKDSDTEAGAGLPNGVVSCRCFD